MTIATLQDLQCTVWAASAKALKFAVSHMSDLQTLVHMPALTACTAQDALGSPCYSEGGKSVSGSESEETENTMAQQLIEAHQAMCRTTSSVHILLTGLEAASGASSCVAGVRPTGNNHSDSIFWYSGFHSIAHTCQISRVFPFVCLLHLPTAGYPVCLCRFSHVLYSVGAGHESYCGTGQQHCRSCTCCLLTAGLRTYVRQSRSAGRSGLTLRLPTCGAACSDAAANSGGVGPPHSRAHARTERQLGCHGSILCCRRRNGCVGSIAALQLS